MVLNTSGMLAKTPEPPYYAVIFTSVRTFGDKGYKDMATKMVNLATKQDGFLGLESAREEIGITVSYWRDLESINKWKVNAEHLIAQQQGKKEWYATFKVRITKVERDYGFKRK